MSDPTPKPGTLEGMIEDIEAMKSRNCQRRDAETDDFFKVGYRGRVYEDDEVLYVLRQHLQAQAQEQHRESEAISACRDMVTELAYLIEQRGVKPGGSVDRAYRRGLAVLSTHPPVAEQGELAEARELLDYVRQFAAAHHADQPAHVFLHALTVDIPEMIRDFLSRHPLPAQGQAGEQVDRCPHCHHVGDICPEHNRMGRVPLWAKRAQPSPNPPSEREEMERRGWTFKPAGDYRPDRWVRNDHRYYVWLDNGRGWVAECGDDRLWDHEDESLLDSIKPVDGTDHPDPLTAADACEEHAQQGKKNQ